MPDLELEQRDCALKECIRTFKVLKTSNQKYCCLAHTPVENAKFRKANLSGYPDYKHNPYKTSKPG